MIEQVPLPVEINEDEILKLRARVEYLERVLKDTLRALTAAANSIRAIRR